VRDIAHVIDDARERAGVDRVTLLGYSFGAQRVGRALYATKFPDLAPKVERVVFLSPFFLNPGGGQPPLEELPEPPGGYVTFPLALDTFAAAAWNMPRRRSRSTTSAARGGPAA
jgi:pimeloyl-ACP methyl ester carboxylesterase